MPELNMKELDNKYKNDLFFKHIVDLVILINTTVPKEILKDAAILAQQKISIKNMLER